MRKRKADSDVVPQAVEDRMIDSLFGFARGEPERAAAAELCERIHAHPCIEMCVDMFLDRSEGAAPWACAGASAAVDIPTISLDLMEKLLVESRDIVAQNGMIGRVGACRHGSKCLGLSPQIGGPMRANAAPLGIWMTREEYEALMESGVAPAERRGCVLCEAHEVCRKYIEARLHTGAASSVHKRIHQPFCVPVDETGGFAARFCIPFEGACGDTSSMVAPILLPQLGMINNTYARKDGARGIDVSRLAHRAHPAAAAGQPPF